MRLNSTEPLPDLSLASRGHAADDSFVLDRDEKVVTLLQVLCASFPVVRKMLGAETFASVSMRFAARALLTISSSSNFGDAFPRFLRELGDLPSIEYLADMAELRLAIESGAAPRFGEHRVA